jgi:hypothetical protein
VSGHYEIELTRADRGWVIGAITYQNALILGDETLPEKALARARQ